MDPSETATGTSHRGPGRQCLISEGQGGLTLGEMASTICQRCGSCPLEARRSLVPQLGGQLRFLATYSCHNLLRIETVAGHGTPTRSPQGQLPRGTGAILTYWPKGKLSLKVWIDSAQSQPWPVRTVALRPLLCPQWPSCYRGGSQFGGGGETNRKREVVRQEGGETSTLWELESAVAGAGPTASSFHV